jgi:hypothetical protein
MLPEAQRTHRELCLAAQPLSSASREDAAQPHRPQDSTYPSTQNAPRSHTSLEPSSVIIPSSVARCRPEGPKENIQHTSPQSGQRSVPLQQQPKPLQHLRRRIQRPLNAQTANSVVQIGPAASVIMRSEQRTGMQGDSHPSSRNIGRTTNFPATWLPKRLLAAA